MDDKIISLINHIIDDEHKNKSLEAAIPKKKKKIEDKVNLKDVITTEEKLLEITKESMDNVNDYDFEKSMIKVKQCKINKASGNNESFETRTSEKKNTPDKNISSEEKTQRDSTENKLLENSLNINNECFETRTPKKKKHNTNQSSKDFTTTEEKLPKITTENINDNDFETSMIIKRKCKSKNVSENNESFKTATQKKKKKNNREVSSEDFINTEEKPQRDSTENKLLENSLSINNECFETRTPKKKKHNTNQNSKDFTTAEEKLPEITTENINDNDFEKSIIIKRKCKSKNVSENNESFETATPQKKKKLNKKVSSKDFINTEEKTHRDCRENEELECSLSIRNESFKTTTPKKKKHNTNQNSKDFTTTEEKLPKITTENSNDNGFEKSIIIKRKCKSKNVSENNESFETATPKKKKKHNKKESSEDFINTEEKTHIDYRENEELECTLSIRNESFKTRTPKKKKHNPNQNSKDFTTAEEELSEITTKNINDNDFEKSTIIKRKCKNKNVSENNESFETETPKKKKKYNKKVSLDFINTEENTHKDSKENEELENSFSINNESFKTRTSKYNKKLIVFKKNKNVNKTYNENNDNMTMMTNENNYDDMSFINESTISKEEKEDDNYDDDDDDLLEALESVIHLCESETDSKINLNQFNLSSYLVTKTSLSDHPNYKSILKHWNQQHKIIINNKYKMGTKSDIILLKFIGKKYIEKIIELLEDFMSIQDLKIQVPVKSKENKLHYVETALRHPNKETMKIIKELNPLVKLGVFNEEEDTIIRKYWSKFQQEHKISVVRPFLLNILPISLPHEEKFNFVRYISIELPNRLLFSVFNRFNVLVNNQRSKFSFKNVEDQFIMKIENCDAFKNKFSILSLILNRTRLQLYRRLNTLKMKPSHYERILWDIDRQQELFTNILLETKTDNWEDLQNMKIKKKTWIKIAKCCGENVYYEKIKSQWKFLSTMLFCKTLIKCSTFKITVLEFLLELKPKYWTDINWTDLTNKLYPGANCKIINTMFRWWVHNTVPSKIRKNVKDTLLYLVTYQKDLVIKKIELGKDKEFRRLTVKNYNLLVEI